MSRDFQLAWPCPHLTVEESVVLGTDRRSLDTLQPVAGSGTVRIQANDDPVFLPQTGLLSAAQLFGAQSGPFDLVENEDTFIVETSVGSHTTTFGIVGRQRWTTERVIKKLQGDDFSVGVVENVNGHLVITDVNKVGPSSFVKVSGTAAASLGFGQAGVNDLQRAARGKKLYPGWELHIRPDEIVNRFPRFVEPLRGNPVFRVTYTVPVQSCRRCQATYVENDIRFAPDGNAVLIDQEDLLYQAALKILLTDRGSNIYHTQYGTTIRSRIGTKALGGTAALISDDVRKALVKLQELQTQQSRVQPVDPKERLYNVLNIQVSPHQDDPTVFLVEVVVQNASADPVSLNIVYTPPGVVALMGSNGLFLGTEAAGLQGGRI